MASVMASGDTLSPLRELPHAADVRGETTTFPTGIPPLLLSHRTRRGTHGSKLGQSRISRRQRFHRLRPFEVLLAVTTKC